jgi:CBS-domain-containing membrane protein
MFTIHGVTGQVFSGTLEEMKRVFAADKARKVRAIEKDGAEMGGVGFEMSRRPQDAAIQAYRRMLSHDLERGPLYHAYQIMQNPVISVSAGDDAAKAWHVLRKHNVHQAPVLNEERQMVGIVSERELLTAVNIDAGVVVESLGRRVADVMTTPVVAAATVTDVRRIAAVMLDQGVDGVPITNDNGHLIGFISRSDILRTLIMEPPLSLWR